MDPFSMTLKDQEPFPTRQGHKHSLQVKENNLSGSHASHFNSIITRVPPTGPVQAQLWTSGSWRQLSKWKSYEDAWRCSPLGELIRSHLISHHRSLTVLRWGRQGDIRVLGFATSLYVQRSHQAMAWSELFCVQLQLQFRDILFRQAEGVLSSVGFWNILPSSQAPDLVELKSHRGSRKCCVWCSFSVNVGCWWNFQL